MTVKLTDLPHEIIASIFKFVPYAERTKIERLNKDFKKISSSQEFILWKMGFANEAKSGFKEDFKKRLSQFAPIIQKFFLENDFSAKQIEDLEELLQNKEYSKALLYLKIFTDEQIYQINGKLGKFYLSHSPHAFYVFAQKLVSYEEITEINQPNLFYAFCLLLNDSVIQCLKKNLIKFKHFTISGVSINASALNAIEKNLITADELTMVCEYKIPSRYNYPGPWHHTEKYWGHLFKLICPFGLYALEKKLLTPMQASKIGALECLLSENGIKALELKLITPEQAAEFVYRSDLRSLLENLVLIETGLLTVKQALEFAALGTLEEHLSIYQIKNNVINVKVSM